jgi:hypothetical protein
MRTQADSGAQTLTAVRVPPGFSRRKALARCAVHPMASRAANELSDDNLDWQPQARIENGSELSRKTVSMRRRNDNERRIARRSA